MIFLKDFFEKVDFEEKNQQTTKKQGKINQHAKLCCSILTLIEAVCGTSITFFWFLNICRGLTWISQGPGAGPFIELSIG